LYVDEGEHESSSDSVITILDDLVKPKFAGRHQRYKLIVTEKHLVFLRLNRRWLFRKRAEISNEEIKNKSPLEIKRMSLGSYMIKIDNLISVRIKESIPFILVLDPKEATNFNLIGGEDDIVHEVPLVLKKDNIKGVDMVERQWELVFEGRGFSTSFLVPYNPASYLPKNILDKKN
jgi:hypothetical protein